MRKRTLFFLLIGATVLAVLAVSQWLIPSAPVSPSNDNQNAKTIGSSGSSGTGDGQSVSPGKSTPDAQASEVALTPAAQHQLQVLDEILQSKNDNDPRLDRELRTLDESAKAALRAKYRSMPPEKLNERGTLVFLLGRNLNSAADVAFLQGVLEERPCLSLADCSKSEGAAHGEEAHLESLDETTLLYVQLAALDRLEARLADPQITPEIRQATLAALRATEGSQSARVAERARRIRQHYFPS